VNVNVPLLPDIDFVVVGVDDSTLYLNRFTSLAPPLVTVTVACGRPDASTHTFSEYGGDIDSSGFGGGVVSTTK
jgi:hypothetical protein